MGRIDGQGSPTHAVAAEPALENLQCEELVEVFHRLVAFGMQPKEAAMASKKYSAQLRELGGMGFNDWPEAVRLLDKYQGRLLRVANAMAESMAEGGGALEAPMPTAPSAAATATAAPASAPAEGCDFQEKMQELISMGFTDTTRNDTLLRKYAGRMERVIEALCSG